MTNTSNAKETLKLGVILLAIGAIFGGALGFFGALVFVLCVGASMAAFLAYFADRAVSLMFTPFCLFAVGVYEPWLKSYRARTCTIEADPVESSLELAA